MPEVLALPLLYDAVVAQFAADSTSCAFAFGWREPARHVTGPRIVFVPGDDLGNLGTVLPPKYPGRNPAPLAAMNELFHVVISTYDLAGSENERLQYTACRLLFDAFARAALKYAGNALVFTNGTWLTDRETRRHGASLITTWAIDAMIPDEIPGTGLSDLLDHNPTNAEIDVTELAVTETVDVDNGAI